MINIFIDWKMAGISPSVLAKSVIAFSKLFAVFPVNIDLTTNSTGLIYTSGSLTLAVVHLYYLPGLMIDIEHELAKVRRGISYNYFLKMLFPAVVFITSIASKISILFFLRLNLTNFFERVRRIDPHLNIQNEDVDKHWWFSITVTTAVCILTFPINLVRLRMFYLVSNGWQTLLLFSHMYFQNISTCWTEAQFATITYGLLIRIRKVNAWLKVLSSRQDFLLHLKYCELTNKYENSNNQLEGWSPSVFYLESRNMLESLTKLRTMHKDICEAVISLQNVYGLALLFSLCCLSLMLLFDIYFEFFGAIGGNVAKPSCATFIWCFQYCFRFVLVAEVSQKIYEEVSTFYAKLLKFVAQRVEKSPGF